MLTHAEIVEILNREVSSADSRINDARQIVDPLISEVPGALPQPDGQHRITIAIKRQIMATEVVRGAVRRNCDFMLYGIIPEDLKKPMGVASQSQPIQTCLYRELRDSGRVRGVDDDHLVALQGTTV